MNNQDINAQGLNAEFKTFLATYPKESLVEIAKRRLGGKDQKESDAQFHARAVEFAKQMPNNLTHAEADPNVIPAYQKGLEEMRQLDDQMPDAVWELAYKKFPMVVKRCRTEDDRRDAISDKFNLSDNEIDATNELKDILKQLICETTFTYKNEEKTLFSTDEAQNSTPAELCKSLEDKLNKMTQMVEEDREDNRIYREARAKNTVDDYFKAMADFLTIKTGETIKGANGDKIYDFVYKQDEDSLIGRHASRGLPVVTVTQNITDHGSVNNPEDMICDINVSGISIPATPSISDTHEMIELQNYVMEHSKYNPSRNGEYDIGFIKASDVPELAYNALQDWAAAATACSMVSNAMEKARVTVGDENMNDLKSTYEAYKMINDYGKSTSGITTTNPEYFKNEISELKQRAKDVRPRVGKADDVSEFINELQAKLRDGLGWESIED